VTDATRTTVSWAEFNAVVAKLSAHISALEERIDLLQHWHTHPMATKTQTGTPEVRAFKPPGVQQPEPRLCGDCGGSFTGPHICTGRP